jgi:hypothetical protein
MDDLARPAVGEALFLLFLLPSVLCPDVSRTLDSGRCASHASIMATVAQVIALASELSEEERRVVVDAIAPKESLEELARAWREEIDRRAARVRSGVSKGQRADEVFERVETKLSSR